jgi:quercetin dioxygenase-like cupin family protein
MLINADFTRRAVVRAEDQRWIPSPQPGVDRVMLDRIGGEVARATSLVRYSPGSRFSAHTHDGGEEFVVLDGVFQDEHGDYPAGAYVRNPPTSSHRPRSEPGCTIFVKLWQFDPGDRESVRVFSEDRPFTPLPARPGVERVLLHRDARESVWQERWAAGAEISLAAPGGVETLVVAGSFTFDRQTFAPLSWLRLPIGDTFTGVGGTDGCTVWVKAGHLSGRVDVTAPTTKSRAAS